jgi:AhpD family alkylhydroperoxidase
MITRNSIVAASLVGLLNIVASHAASAGDANAAYQDIGETYGTIPGFFRLFSSDEVADAWEAFKLLQLNPDLTIEAKARELIGVAVATQGTCTSCVYFHAAAAMANGASMEEIRDAVGVGTATRRLSAAFSKADADLDTFKTETDLVLWGDARTVELRGPLGDFCTFIIALANAEYAGCD